MHVITTTVPVQAPVSAIADARLVWISPDDRSIAPEIVAPNLGDALATRPRQAHQLAEVTTMPKRPTYPLGPDVASDEVLRDRQGRVVDDAYAEAATEEALSIARRRGRPSLSRSGESPLLRVRLSRELDEAVTHAAEQAGISRADWVRRILAQAARKAS